MLKLKILVHRHHLITNKAHSSKNKHKILPDLRRNFLQKLRLDKATISGKIYWRKNATFN